MTDNKSVRNERRKLMSTFVNNVGVASIGVGGLTQIAAMINGSATSPFEPYFVVVCVIGGVALHWIARFLLRGMEE